MIFTTEVFTYKEVQGGLNLARLTCRLQSKLYLKLQPAVNLIEFFLNIFLRHENVNVHYANVPKKKSTAKGG